MVTLAKCWLVRLQKFINRPWYVPFISALAALDLFVLIIPSDALMVSGVLANRKRWVRTFLWVSTGSALGALALSALIQSDSQLITERLLPYLFQTPGWDYTAELINKYGLPALVIVSVSFLPQQPAVALVALAGMSLSQIFLAVWVGRAIKYGLFAWCASYAPNLLNRIWFLRKELQELEQSKVG